MVSLRPRPHMRFEVEVLERRRRELLAQIRVEKDEGARAQLEYRLHFVEGALVAHLGPPSSSPFRLHDPARRTELDARVAAVMADLKAEEIPDALDQKIEAFRRLDAISPSS